ncbi:MAG: hypothetical protein ACI4XW_12915 [Candidatus Spyradocola sp.]
MIVFYIALLLFLAPVFVLVVGIPFGILKYFCTPRPPKKMTVEQLKQYYEETEPTIFHKRRKKLH